MFPLASNDIPATAADWVHALTASLSQWVAGSPKVRVDGEPPAIRAIDIDLSNARVEAATRPDVDPFGTSEPGPTVAALRVVASPIAIHGTSATFELSATDVRFDIGRNAAGVPIVMLANATDGRLSAGIGQADLDVALLRAARAGAQPHGVEIQSIRSRLTATNPRDLNVAVDLTARKIVKFTVRVTGHLAIDDRLTATATELKVESSGMAAGFAAAILRTQLKKLEGQRLRLTQFNLGAVRLREVSVDTANGLAVRASFGGP